jgi:hypothetical protein
MLEGTTALRLPSLLISQMRNPVVRGHSTIFKNYDRDTEIVLSKYKEHIQLTNENAALWLWLSNPRTEPGLEIRYTGPDAEHAYASPKQFLLLM